MPTLSGFTVTGTQASPGSTINIDYQADDDSGALSCVIFQFHDPIGGSHQIRADGMSLPLTGTITYRMPDDWANGTATLEWVTLCDPAGNQARLDRTGNIHKLPSGATGPNSHGHDFAEGDLTVAAPPSAPTDVRALASGELSAEVTWTASQANGAQVTQYRVEATPGGIAVTIPGNQTRAVIGGLRDDTRYSFTVSASNRVGNSPPSVPSNPVQPGHVPSTPIDVTATSADGAAHVSWMPVSGNGSPITSTATATPGRHSCTTAGATDCTVTGLTNGTNYTFTVIATNALGDSPPSEPSNQVTPAGVPAAPEDVAVERRNRSATLTWTEPSNNGSPITGYTVTATPGGRSCATVAATSCTVTGLTNGINYTFTVIATNALGDSADATVSATPAARPTRPRRPSVRVRGHRLIVVWKRPNDRGARITRYRISVGKAEAKTVPGRKSRTVIRGLDRGRYRVRVAAKNRIGWSQTSRPRRVRVS